MKKKIKNNLGLHTIRNKEKKEVLSRQRIFMDFASTTPLEKKVLEAMSLYMTNHFGNPSAIYKEGILAKEAVQQARKSMAAKLHVRPHEIIFTASGTEADNMAVMGVYNACLKHFHLQGKKPHIITSTIEHPGILEVCRYLETQGAEVTYIPLNSKGIISINHVRDAIKETTVLISIMYANNEIGTIQPIHQVARIAKNYQRTHTSVFPYVHTDASQAANYLDLNCEKLGVDMMTLDASKIYGPKGIGLLAIKKHVEITPFIYGGGQEKGLRSGTENVPGIIGMAEAMRIADKIQTKEIKRLTFLRNYFIQNVIKLFPDVIINGDIAERLPNNINFCIQGLDAEFAVIQLDHYGISCSSASSCMNLSENSYSYVIDALPEKGKYCKESSLRFSLGRTSTKEEVEYCLKALKKVLIQP